MFWAAAAVAAPGYPLQVPVAALPSGLYAPIPAAKCAPRNCSRSRFTPINSRKGPIGTLHGFICNRFRSNSFFTPLFHLNSSDPGTSIGYWSAIVAQQYYTLLLQRLRKHGIDRGFYALLAIADNDGRLSQQELAKLLHVEKVTMFRIIDTLSEKGLVQRVDCPDDRRKHHIRLLPKARPLVKEIRKAYAELNDLAFEGLSKTQRKAFIEQFNGMLQRLSIGDLRPATIKYQKLPR